MADKTRLRRRFRAVRRARSYAYKATHRPRDSAVAGLLRSTQSTTVLDVGANIGQYGRYLRAAGFAGTIVSCEPLPAAFDQLAARASADPAWVVEKVAVGAEPDTIQIHESGNSVSSSVLPVAESHLALSPESEYVATHDASMVTIANLVDKHGINPGETVLKIDVQGFEWQVLDGCHDYLGQFAGVVLEMCLLELYDGQRLFPDLFARMTAAGYELWNLEPGHVVHHTGRMWWCDGLFVRTDIAGRGEFAGLD